jgi:hypothetical protein
MTLIKTLTASSSSTLSFVHGASSVVLDNTYPIYIFKFINIHPANDGSGVNFQFQGSVNGGSGYGVNITSTAFLSQHNEDDSNTNFEYKTDHDLAQSTDFQELANFMGNDNDQSCSGHLTLFNPSSTTFVKQWIANTNNYTGSNFSVNFNYAGYFNTTSAINAIQFKIASGAIASGAIKLYGIKDS